LASPPPVYGLLFWWIDNEFVHHFLNDDEKEFLNLLEREIHLLGSLANFRESILTLDGFLTKTPATSAGVLSVTPRVN